MKVFSSHKTKDSSLRRDASVETSFISLRDLGTMMKIFFGVLVSAYVASGAVYISDLHRFLGNLTVTKFDYPSFVERNYTDEESADCRDRLGQFIDGTFDGTPSKYNVLDVLKALGGAPGEVEASKRNEVPESPVEDPTKRPLEDGPEDKWLYDYRASDYQYYYRLEHAVKRFAGTDKEFLDIRGRLAWAPQDTCGRLRVADYQQDDTGFSADVSSDYCNFQGRYFSCATIPYCNTKPNGDRVCIG